MSTVAMAAVLVGVLAALALAPLLDRLRPASRRPSDRLATRWPGRIRRVADYPSLLDSIARQVRSGSSLAAAVLDEVDRSSGLAEVVDRLTTGGSLVDALAGIVTPETDPDLALAVQALSASAHLGGPVAATLDEAAAVLRERSAARAERRAHASQARLSARVLTIVPLAFAGWSALASRHTRDVYVTTVAGGVSALCGLALNACGWLWMKRIIGPT